MQKNDPVKYYLSSGDDPVEGYVESIDPITGLAVVVVPIMRFTSVYVGDPLDSRASNFCTE